MLKGTSLLFTAPGNPTSNRIYQRMGYQPDTDVDVYEGPDA